MPSTSIPIEQRLNFSDIILSFTQQTGGLPRAAYGQHNIRYVSLAIGLVVLVCVYRIGLSAMTLPYNGARVISPFSSDPQGAILMIAYFNKD